MRIILLPLRCRDCIIGIAFRQLAGTYRMRLWLKSAIFNFERYEILGIICTRLCEPMKVSSDSNSPIYSRGNKGMSLLPIFRLFNLFICDIFGKLLILSLSNRKLIRSDKVTMCCCGISEIEFPITDRLSNLCWLRKSGNDANLTKSSLKNFIFDGRILALNDWKLMPPRFNISKRRNAKK